ncbi:MAG: Nif11-like leader peptide family RiPP precursor [Ignavibacteriales bacterium]
MSEDMKKLIEKVKSDKALAAKFNACKSVDEQVKLANELGFKVPASDFQSLSDEQLDKVAGGCGINIFEF